MKKPAKQEEDNFTIFITLVKGNKFCFNLPFCFVIGLLLVLVTYFSPFSSDLAVLSRVAQQRRHGNNNQDCPDSQMRQLRYLRTPRFIFTLSFLLKNLFPLSSQWSPEELGRGVHLLSTARKEKKKKLLFTCRPFLLFCFVFLFDLSCKGPV